MLRHEAYVVTRAQMTRILIGIAFALYVAYFLGVDFGIWLCSPPNMPRHAVVRPEQFVKEVS